MSAEQRAGQNSLQRRSAARTAVVWDALQEVLEDSGGPSGASVVDIGGGTGGVAGRGAPHRPPGTGLHPPPPPPGGPAPRGGGGGGGGGGAPPPGGPARPPPPRRRPPP